MANILTTPHTIALGRRIWSEGFRPGFRAAIMEGIKARSLLCRRNMRYAVLGPLLDDLDNATSQRPAHGAGMT